MGCCWFGNGLVNVSCCQVCFILRDAFALFGLVWYCARLCERVVFAFVNSVSLCEMDLIDHLGLRLSIAFHILDTVCVFGNCVL